MRRRAPDQRGAPEYLLRYDWRDWRPPAAADDPCPWYSTWYLGLFAWREAREQWAAGREIQVRQLPREVRPPQGDVFTTSSRPVNDDPQVNRATVRRKARPIKLR
ncbi:hypothetical protein [Streptomyces sp. NPDC005408]|uniref:hypothetical protein n=1 Tax=Streptomyces sp. NPDC005408 TaxID=3155341 RepID=UPI00339E9FA1